MSLPGNGIFVLRGEISTLITAVKRGARWNNSNYQVRIKSNTQSDDVQKYLTICLFCRKKNKMVC